MKNEIRVADGIIRFTYHGKQTAETIAESGKELADSIDAQRESGGPILVLVDISDLGGLTTGARFKAIDIVKAIDFDKMATFGGSPLMQGMNNLVKKALKKGDRLGYFQTESEAAEWLKT